MPTFDLTTQVKIVNPSMDVDALKGPFNSISEALVATANLRKEGRTVTVLENGSAVEYWFKDGIADADLILKTIDVNDINADYIPLTGTTQPEPVTGNVIFKAGTEPQSLELIKVGGVWTVNIKDATGTSKSTITGAGKANIGAITIDSTARGISSTIDHSSTLQSLDYTQKIHLDFRLSTKADLVNGRVPESQLPSYIDQVQEYPTRPNFPVTGQSDIIYVAADTSTAYRWSGTTYVQIGSGLVLGTTSSTAGRGDYTQAAYTHSQVTGANPHATTHAQILAPLGGQWHLQEAEHDYLADVVANDDIGNIYNLLRQNPTYVTPVSYIQSSPNVFNSYEVGTSVGVNISQFYTQNNGGNPTSQVIYKNTNTVSTGSTFTETLTVPNGTTAYSGKVFYAQGACLNDNLGQQNCTGRIPSGSTTSPEQIIMGLYRKYGGSVSAFPTNGTNLRTALLSSSVVNSSNTFSFTTGTTNRRFVIAIPATKTLVSAQNTGTNEFLTFTLDNSVTTVPDAANTSVSYKYYTLQNAVPFSNNYTINVTIS